MYFKWISLSIATALKKEHLKISEKKSVFKQFESNGIHFNQIRHTLWYPVYMMRFNQAGLILSSHFSCSADSKTLTATRAQHGVIHSILVLLDKNS